MGGTVTDVDLDVSDISPSRACGLETEYALHFRSQKSGAVIPSNDMIFESLWFAAKQAGYAWPVPGLEFLRNGARLHLDFGHAEWATPECQGPLQAVLYDVAGEQLIASLLPSANDYLEQKGFSGQIHIYKNNVDTQGNTYGCHENYQVARTTPGLPDPDDFFRYLIKCLVPFLVTRQILCGAGHVVSSAEESDRQRSFHISQRSTFIDEVVSVEATSRRAIVNSRDEPHGDLGQWRRLHLILGDANLSPWSSFLKLGTTALVLRMIEHTFWMDDLTLDEPVKALKQISADPTCQTFVRLRDQRQIRALTIQQRYCEESQRFIRQCGGTAEEEHLLELWSDCLKGLETGALSKQLDRRLDWLIKQKFIQKQMSGHQLSWDSPVVQEMDIKYHDIDPQRGIYQLLQKNNFVERLLSAEAILKAFRQPPRTRAALRSELIEAVYGLGWLGNVDWAEVEIRQENDNSLIVLPDPLEWDKSTITAILEKKASLAHLQRVLFAQDEREN